jgi:hypothetical protein
MTAIRRRNAAASERNGRVARGGCPRRVAACARWLRELLEEVGQVERIDDLAADKHRHTGVASDEVRSEPGAALAVHRDLFLSVSTLALDSRPSGAAALEDTSAKTSESTSKIESRAPPKSPLRRLGKQRRQAVRASPGE